METPETIRTSLQVGEWVTSIDFKDAYFHIPIHSQSRKYMRFHIQGQSYQFKALPFGLSTAPTERYKNPPVHRRLVGESHTPPNLSPAYTDLGSSLSRIRLAGEQGEVRTGPKTGFQLRRLPVRSQGGQGQTHTRALADFNRQDIVNPVRSGVPGPAVHVPHRTSNSHRKAYAFPPAAILGKVVEKLQDYPCNRIILIALGWPNMPRFWDLVAMSSQIPLCLPNLPNLVSQPFNQTLHRNLSNLNLHAWPQQSRSRGSLRQWQHELRLLKEDQPDPSMRQSGPFLQSGASVIRWTSGHHL